MASKLKIVKWIALVAILLVAVTLLVFSLKELKSDLKQPQKTDIISYQNGYLQSQNATISNVTSQMVVIVTNLYSYIIAGLAMFLTTIIRFFANLLCEKLISSEKGDD
jgi:hypothetical protein